MSHSFIWPGYNLGKSDKRWKKRGVILSLQTDCLHSAAFYTHLTKEDGSVVFENQNYHIVIDGESCTSGVFGIICKCDPAWRNWIYPGFMEVISFVCAATRCRKIGKQLTEQTSHGWSVDNLFRADWHLMFYNLKLWNKLLNIRRSATAEAEWTGERSSLKTKCDHCFASGGSNSIFLNLSGAYWKERLEQNQSGYQGGSIEERNRRKRTERRRQRLEISQWIPWAVLISASYRKILNSNSRVTLEIICKVAGSELRDKLLKNTWKQILIIMVANSSIGQYIFTHLEYLCNHCRNLQENQSGEFDYLIMTT